MSDELAIVVGAATGPVLRAFGEEVTILLDSEQTGGRLTMWLETTPPGGGPPPHFHINDDETFHVLEGRVAFTELKMGRGRSRRISFCPARTVAHF
ncbi:MAG TPA: hypothetical protein VLI42_06870 [Chthoniobacterales bacterium]|nr:hypothetical protein [Chthoniobacterales bacterium]